MSNSDLDRSTGQRVFPDEPQAPPYVLHRHPIPSDQIESLPLYSEEHYPNAPIRISELNEILREHNRPRENDIVALRRYIDGIGATKVVGEDRTFAEACMPNYFFEAIENGQEDVVNLLLEHQLVTANTKFGGTTPLLMAVSKKNVEIARQLLKLGADPNEFSFVYARRFWDISNHCWTTVPVYSSDPPTLRTPLQLAASLGHLVLVKLLIEQHHADDAIIAPDGQIALRLAAENNHREIVDYLPSRRGGGFRRWQHKNKKAIRRINRAAAGIAEFVKFFVWDVEKFFLWTCPKHVLVVPLRDACRWCWKYRRGFGPWCVRQVKAFPRRVGRGVRWVGRTIKGFGKWLWKVFLKIPRIVREVSARIWYLLKVRLPNAIKLLAGWVADGFTSVAKVVWNAILKVVSFLSTFISAIVSFFRELTLKDIWNGFCEALRAVFVALPKLLWSWVKAFGDVSYKIMKALLGGLGEVLWYIGYGILWVAMFVPKKLWIMLESFGGVIAKAGYEIRVWMDPKAR